MPQKILSCVAYDEGTDTCTTQAWIDQPALLPSLSLADAETLGLYIAFLWGTAWGIRMMKRALDT